VIWYAVFSHVKYDAALSFDKQMYKDDAEVAKKQKILKEIFGGDEKWEALRNMQNIFWPNEKMYPTLLSASEQDRTLAKEDERLKEGEKGKEKIQNTRTQHEVNDKEEKTEEEGNCSDDNEEEEDAEN